jgi:hypothetical protein
MIAHTAGVNHLKIVPDGFERITRQRYTGPRGCGLGLWHTSSTRKDSTDSKPRQRVGRGPKTAEAFLRKKKIKSKEVETMKAHAIDLEVHH